MFEQSTQGSCRDPDKKVIYVIADVTLKTDIVKAFNEAEKGLGGNPEIVIACAGMSHECLNKVDTRQAWPSQVSF